MPDDKKKVFSPEELGVQPHVYSPEDLGIGGALQGPVRTKPTPEETDQAMSKTLGTVGSFAPSVGAMAGEAFGGPIGSPIGGMAGKLLGNALQGRPNIMEDVPKEGATQGIYTLAGAGIGKVLGKVLPSAEGLYRSALGKGGMDSGELERLPRTVDTGLHSTETTDAGFGRKVAAFGLGEKPAGTTISKKGLESTEVAKNAVKGQVSRMISDAEANGAKIMPSEVMKHMDDLEAFYRQSSHGEEYANAVAKYKQEYLAANSTPGVPSKPTGLVSPSGTPIMSSAVPPKEIPQLPSDIQKMKQTDYKLIGDNRFGQLTPVDTESRKRAALGAKEALENIVPELKGLNAKEQSMIDLEGAIERAVTSQGFKHVEQPGAHAAIGMLEMGRPSYFASVGMMKQLLTNPEIRSKVAIAMDMWNRRSGPSKMVNMQNLIRGGGLAEGAMSDKINEAKDGALESIGYDTNSPDTKTKEVGKIAGEVVPFLSPGLREKGSTSTIKSALREKVLPMSERAEIAEPEAAMKGRTPTMNAKERAEFLKKHGLLAP